MQHKCPECGEETERIFVRRSEEKTEAYRCEACNKTWYIELLKST